MQVFSAVRRVLDAGWKARGTAVRIGVSFVIPFSIAAALGHVEYGAVATLGAFAATYARDQPYRQRMRVMLAVTVGLAAAVVLGTLTAGAPVAMAIGAAVVAGTAALAGLAWETGPPREFMIVLAYLASTTYPGDVGDIPLRAGLVLAGGLIVTAIAGVGYFSRPRGPEEDAIRNALLALAAMMDALGSDQIREARHRALLTLQHARSVLAKASGVRVRGDRLAEIAISGEAVTDTTLSLAWHNHAPLDPAWARTVRTIADSVRDPSVARGLVVPETAPDGPDGRRLASAIDRAARAADPQRAMEATMVPFRRRSSRRWNTAIRRALHPGSLVLPTAIRVGIAVGVGTAVGLLLGVDHGVWVGLSASAVLQASNVSLVRTRTLQRALGTLVGVGLAAALLIGDPSLLVLVIALLVCQTLAQATIQDAYGVAVVFTTPIALMIVEIGQPGTPAESLLRERVLDTLVGVAIGLAARRLLWPRTAATQLPKAQGEAIEAAHGALIAALTRADAPSSSLVRRTRRSLQTAMLNLRAVHHDAIGDLVWSTAGADARWPTTVAVQRLAHASMAVAAPADVEPDRELVERLDAALTVMALIVQGHRTPSVVPVPPMPDHRAVQHALTELADVLAPVGEGT
ncbi:MAG: FUSC family protein [Patulibacter sp.]